MEISEPVRQATLSYLQRLQEEEDSYSPDRELDALISIFETKQDLVVDLNRNIGAAKMLKIDSNKGKRFEVDISTLDYYAMYLRSPYEYVRSSLNGKLQSDVNNAIDKCVRDANLDCYKVYKVKTPWKSLPSKERNDLFSRLIDNLKSPDGYTVEGKSGCSLNNLIETLDTLNPYSIKVYIIEDDISSLQDNDSSNITWKPDYKMTWLA